MHLAPPPTPPPESPPQRSALRVADLIATLVLCLLQAAGLVRYGLVAAVGVLKLCFLLIGLGPDRPCDDACTAAEIRHTEFSLIALITAGMLSSAVTCAGLLCGRFRRQVLFLWPAAGLTVLALGWLLLKRFD